MGSRHGSRRVGGMAASAVGPRAPPLLRAGRPRSRAPVREGAAAPRSRSRAHPDSTLQPADREGVRRLDPSLHPVSRPAASPGDGRGGAFALPLFTRGRREGERLDAEPGAGGPAVSLPRGPGPGRSLAPGGRAGEAAAAASRGPHARRGTRCPERAARHAETHGGAPLRGGAPPVRVRPGSAPRTWTSVQTSWWCGAARAIAIE